MKRLLSLATLAAVIKLTYLTEDDKRKEPIPTEHSEAPPQMPNFRFDKIEISQGSASTRANYYFEFSIENSFIEKMRGKDTSWMKSQLSILFPADFGLWIENSSRSGYWILQTNDNILASYKEGMEGIDNNDEELVESDMFHFKYQEQKMERLFDANRLITFDLSKFIKHSINLKKNNDERWKFGVVVTGIDNPPKEGYLGLFEAELRFDQFKPIEASSSSLNKNEDELINKEKEKIKLNARSMIKHGQKIFLRKEFKKIKIIKPFEEYSPGFYSSEFKIEIESGCTYPIEIIPVSDDDEIEFEPKIIRFDPIDHIYRSVHLDKELSNGQQSSPSAKQVKDYRGGLDSPTIKTFRIIIGTQARLGDHKIRFRKKEHTVSAFINQKKGRTDRRSYNYSPIPMINYKVKKPPCQLCSTVPEPFHGEKPSLGFKQKYMTVPFEGISYPSHIKLSHAPSERLKVKIQLIKPAQTGMITLHNEELYFEKGQRSANFYVSSKLGAVSGLITMNIDDKIYKKLLKINRKRLNIDVVDFETVHTEVNRVIVDGNLVLEDEVQLNSQGRPKNKGDKKKKVSLNDRKITMLDPEIHQKEIQHVLKGRKMKNFFASKLLELEEDIKNDDPNDQQDNDLECEHKITLHLSKQAKVYAIGLLFPRIHFPSIEIISKLIEGFCHRTEEQVLKFPSHGLVISKTSTPFHTEDNNFIAQFEINDFGFKGQFENHIIFLTEDRAHTKKIMNLKVKTKKKEDLKLFQIEFSVVPQSFTYDRLINLISLFTQEHHKWFKPHYTETLDHFIQRTRDNELSKKQAHTQLQQLNTCYTTYIVYFFTQKSQEELDKMEEELKSVFRDPRTHLLLYYEEPPVEDTNPCHHIQQIQLSKISHVCYPLDKIKMNLIESKSDALLVNYHHKSTHGYHQYFNYTDVSQIKERFEKTQKNDLQLIDCMNGICQQLYHGLEELKDYIIKVKGCADYQGLGLCSRDHSSLLAVTQPMVYLDTQPHKQKEKSSWVASFAFTTLMLFSSLGFYC